MKNKIINEDNLKIKKLVNKILKEHISNSQIVSEQSIVPRVLKKLLGSRIVQKLESSKGDDVIRELESLFAKGERNLATEAGQVAFKSATGSNIKMSQIQNGIELVLDGSHTPDEVASWFPRNLEDGTDFRSQLLSLLKKQKPNGIVTIDVVDFITKNYPNIGKNPNIFNSLVREAQQDLAGKTVSEQISFLNRECGKIHAAIQPAINQAEKSGNRKLADKLHEIDRSVSVISKWAKNLGPLSFNKSGEIRPIASILKAAGWLFGAAVIIDSMRDYSESDGDLYEYLLKNLVQKGKTAIGTIFGLFSKNKKSEDDSNPDEGKRLY
jgi:hypothetical protein